MSGYCAEWLAQFLKEQAPAKLSSEGIWLIAAVMGVVLLWLARISRKWERSRTEDLRSLAASMGFTLELRKPQDFPNMKRLCPDGCVVRSVTNIIRGRRGDLEVVAFDCFESYRNRLKGDNNRETFACFRRCGKKLPWFSLAPGKLPSRLPVLAAIFGIGVVTLDPVSEFSKNFIVHTRDHNPASAKEVFTPALQNQVLNLDVRHEWRVWGDGEWVRLSTPAQPGLLPLEEYAGFIQRTGALADVFLQASR